jgi:hypothetical protein
MNTTEIRASFGLKGMITTIEVRLWRWPDQIRIEIERGRGCIFETNIDRTKIDDAFFEKVISKLQEATEGIQTPVTFIVNTTGGIFAKCTIDDIKEFIQSVIETIDRQAL